MRYAALTNLSSSLPTLEICELYLEARTIRDNMERRHQYCRCIDGLIVPDIGKSRKQIKRRTEPFIGPRCQELMGETYDVRSDVDRTRTSTWRFSIAQRVSTS